MRFESVGVETLEKITTLYIIVYSIAQEDSRHMFPVAESSHFKT